MYNRRNQTILITIFIIPLPFDAKGYELIIELGHYKINYNEIVVELLKLITAFSFFKTTSVILISSILKS